MKASTSCCTLTLKNLLIMFFMLALSAGCASEAEKEFRKASGQTVAVDQSYRLLHKYGEANAVEAGAYKFEFGEENKKYIRLVSLVTDDSILIDYTEYRNIIDNKLFRNATPADIEKAQREKKAGHKLYKTGSVSLQNLVLVAGKQYQRESIIRAIDATDSNAKYRPDQSVIFKLERKYYYMGMAMISSAHPAVYKITFIKYKGLPWTYRDQH
jgi:hypothetical protein